jgi:predicted dehydrogenase
MSQRKRYAIVGTGGRAGMFVNAVTQTYREVAELVALCDLSQTRMNWYNQKLADELDMAPRPTYAADQFDQMIAETKPDTVIVSTMDSTHHLYIVRAMELGCDVISEKPMTTDVDKLKAIYEAIERTGRSLRVTFNYRYAPAYTRFRQLVMEGVVGRPLLVDFSWLLDTSHGADYFRRWHREKENSGGLLVHKATHHFDLVNWWIEAYPKAVFALGNLHFYGRTNAEARGQTYSYHRYTNIPEAQNDPFALVGPGERTSTVVAPAGSFSIGTVSFCSLSRGSQRPPRSPRTSSCTLSLLAITSERPFAVAVASSSTGLSAASFVARPQAATAPASASVRVTSRWGRLGMRSG